MKYVIELNDKTQAGRSLLSVVRTIQKNAKEISIRSEKEMDEMTDFAIGKAIELRSTGKFTSRKRIMELLDR